MVIGLRITPTVAEALWTTQLQASRWQLGLLYQRLFSWAAPTETLWYNTKAMQKHNSDRTPGHGKGTTMTSRLQEAEVIVWDRLSPFGQAQSFRRHNTIYTPTQPAQTLYLLMSGQVGLHLASREGRLLTMRVVEERQAFGLSVFERDATYDTFAEALTPVRVLAVPRSEVLQAMAEDGTLAMAMLELLGQQRMIVSRRIEEVAFKSVPARLASVLLEMSETQQVAAPQPNRLPRRTHQQLADMINAYRETVTKVINQFRDARLLDVDSSGITLLNPSRLRELAQS
ncbi:MAG: cyclic nucleotide-binding protein [Chloroflexus sp.]|nr:MAG: cyclic nucleotide-binding protein [Chloroflexus sp.]